MFPPIPLLPAILTLFPIFICPVIAHWPPIRQFLPIIVDPAIAVKPAIAVFFPIFTLWPIWIRLSSLTPSSIIVEPNEALSIVVFAPISTFFFVITFPKCLIFSKWFSFGANPKPSSKKRQNLF